MTKLTNNEDDRVRTSNIVTFRCSESVINKHKHYQGTPCNKNGAFYPRQNHIYLDFLHSNLFLDNLLPIMNENFLLIKKIFNHHFPF